ncbi:hypothetical protein [Embleya sp. NPDC005971]|uniref:hypothetical protein n=1 Tax=Embleya sp. NPDC005971 TaxID=3156724 RepID=UPI0033F6B148
MTQNQPLDYQALVVASAAPRESDPAPAAHAQAPSGGGPATPAPEKSPPARESARPKRSPAARKAIAAGKRTKSLKYVQLREDQVIELDLLARELQAGRTTKTERLTANTIIRVAIDTALAHQHLLVGDTEAELLDNYRRALDTALDAESRKDQES